MFRALENLDNINTSKYWESIKYNIKMPVSLSSINRGFIKNAQNCQTIAGRQKYLESIAPMPCL
jgi:hypothetical protein